MGYQELDTSTTSRRFSPLKLSAGADAAHALGELGDARAIEPLRKALRDDHRVVRRTAQEALGKLGQPTKKDRRRP